MSRTTQGLIAMTAGFAAALALTGIASATSPDVEGLVSSGLRWTGRLAFLVFLVPWLASPLQKLYPSAISQLLLRWRRQAGIAFGSIQVVHLGLIVGLYQIYEDPGVDAATLVVGGAGILLAMFMLITSFDGPLQLVGSRAWKALHRSGIYVCGFIYFFDFLVAPFLADYDLLAYAPLMVLTAVAIGLRTMALLKKMKAEKTRSATGLPAQ
jgi:hypothetical protein